MSAATGLAPLRSALDGEARGIRQVTRGSAHAVSVQQLEVRRRGRKAVVACRASVEVREFLAMPTE
jgi:hypothetical protein